MSYADLDLELESILIIESLSIMARRAKMHMLSAKNAPTAEKRLAAIEKSREILDELVTLAGEVQ